MITKHKSSLGYKQILLTNTKRNVYKTVWRICILMKECKELMLVSPEKCVWTQVSNILLHLIKFTFPWSSKAKQSKRGYHPSEEHKMCILYKTKQTSKKFRLCNLPFIKTPQALLRENSNSTSYKPLIITVFENILAAMF